MIRNPSNIFMWKTRGSILVLSGGFGGFVVGWLFGFGFFVVFCDFFFKSSGFMYLMFRNFKQVSSLVITANLAGKRRGGP